MAGGRGELRNSRSSVWPARERTQEIIQRFRRCLSGCVPIISLAEQSLLPLESERNIHLAERNTHGWTPSPIKAIREGFAPFLQKKKKSSCCQDGSHVFVLLLRRASLQMKRYQFYPSWGRIGLRGTERNFCFQSCLCDASYSSLTWLWRTKIYGRRR